MTVTIVIPINTRCPRFLLHCYKERRGSSVSQSSRATRRFSSTPPPSLTDHRHSLSPITPTHTPTYMRAGRPRPRSSIAVQHRPSDEARGTYAIKLCYVLYVLPVHISLVLSVQSILNSLYCQYLTHCIVNALLNFSCIASTQCLDTQCLMYCQYCTLVNVSCIVSTVLCIMYCSTVYFAMYCQYSMYCVLT